MTAIQYKAVGARSLTDEGKGIVSALVSVTGIVDNVKDIIEPGAYTKSLSNRIPKGVWHHSWTEPVAKTLDVIEYMPGDQRLPKSLPNGQPWPPQAGALFVKMQFNLNTQRGRDAYEDVKFYGDQQEWSIGYNVPVGAATVKDGVRRIKSLELYEYSPVLFGAMSNARTTSVKSAQEAFREAVELKGDEAEAFLMEVKTIFGEDLELKAVEKDEDEESEEPGTDADQGVDDPPLDEDEEPADDEEDEEEKTMFSGAQAASIQAAIEALQAILTSIVPAPDLAPPVATEEHQEEKSWFGGEVKTLTERVKAAGLNGLVGHAEKFDAAAESLDVKAMSEHGEPIIEALEMAALDEDLTDELKAVAKYISESIEEAGGDEDGEDGTDPVEDEEDAGGDEADEVDDEAKSHKPSTEVKAFSLADLDDILN